jgi:Predicted Peptidoglycan domain
MTIDDIINAASQKFPERFCKWLRFIMEVEATVDYNGNILREDDHDGAGITMAGLNQKDDNLPDNPTPEWFAVKYHDNYWAESRADLLPVGVGEEIANIAVNEGLGTSARILQESISALGVHINVDGQIGKATEDAAFQEDAHQLALMIGKYNDEHYKEIADKRPDLRQNLRGWLNRDQQMIQTFA